MAILDNTIDFKQSEIADLKKSISTATISFNNYFQNFSDMLASLNGLSQITVNWNIPAQFQEINSNIGNWFTTQLEILNVEQDSLQMLIESVLSGYQLVSDNQINTTDLLTQIVDWQLADWMKNILNEIIVFKQGCFSWLNATKNVLDNSLNTLSETRDICCNIQMLAQTNNVLTDLNLEMMIILAEVLNNRLMQSVVDLLNATQNVSQLLSGVDKFLKTDFKGYFLWRFLADLDWILIEVRDTLLAETANLFAEEGNDLAKEGNQLAEKGNKISSASISFSVVDLLASTTTGIGGLALAMAADGGFPSVGQMFIAREAGPELVGTIGSRNAVVNNNQIVESVSAGVYRAVKEAMGGRNSGNIVITLDKRVLGEFAINYINGKTKENGLSPILV